MSPWLCKTMDGVVREAYGGTLGKGVEVIDQDLTGFIVKQNAEGIQNMCGANLIGLIFIK